jgi:hypothetical protein
MNHQGAAGRLDAAPHSHEAAAAIGLRIDRRA